MSKDVTIGWSKGSYLSSCAGSAIFQKFIDVVVDIIKVKRPALYEIICGGNYHDIRIDKVKKDDFKYIYNLILKNMKEIDEIYLPFLTDIIDQMKIDDRYED